MSETLGLRDRKRQQTMRRIQRTALDLFDERGFDGVTIEQIAEAAEVSPSTVYRYFGTKESLIIDDDADDEMRQWLAELLEHEDLHDALATMINSVSESDYAALTAQMERRARYLQVPSVRAAALLDMERFCHFLTDRLVERNDPPRTRFGAHVLATATAWGLFAAVESWVAGQRERDVRSTVLAAIDVLRGSAAGVPSGADSDDGGRAGL